MVARLAVNEEDRDRNPSIPPFLSASSPHRSSKAILKAWDGRHGVRFLRGGPHNKGINTCLSFCLVYWLL